MKDFSYEVIGVLQPLSRDFVAYAGDVLVACSYWSKKGKTIRFVSFVPSSALSCFALLTATSKIKILRTNELSKDNLSLILCEYNIVSSRKYKL